MPEESSLIDYPALAAQARERIKALEINIEGILDRIAGEKRACRACGVMLWMVRHKNGKVAPYTIDGTNHFANCKQADRFKRTAAK